MAWSDSIVVLDQPAGDGGIQTMKGSCPVKYTFNDGIERYNPNASSVFSFKDFKDNDIVWVFESDFTKNIY